MPCIYFICAEGDEGYFKIGCTDNLKGRLAQLQCGNRRKLIVYKLIESDDHFGAERIAHEHFKDYRENGEWFCLTTTQVDDFILQDLRTLNTVDGSYKRMRSPRDWQLFYNTLKDYMDSDDKILPIKSLFIYAGIKLGSWCNVQSNNHRKGLLANDKVQLLELLPDWKWSKNTLTFDDKINALESFMINNSRIPFNYESIDNINVGKFAYLYRGKYRKNTLSVDIIKAFEKIPHWKWDVNMWMDYYNDLLEYVTSANALPDKNQQRLHEWCSSNNNRNNLSEDRIQLLEKIPHWKWANYKKYDWVKLLDGFYTQNNRLPTSGELFQDAELGRWVCQQKAKIKKGIDKYDLLSKFPDIKRGVWYSSRDIVCEWMTEHKRIPPQSLKYRGIKIGTWVRNQWRDLDSLTDERVDSLDAIPHWKW